MKMLWLALLVSPAYADQMTLDFNSGPFTDGAFAGQSVTGEIVLDVSSLVVGLGNGYIPISESFSIGGKPLTFAGSQLTYEYFNFTQYGGQLQGYDFALKNDTLVIDGSGAMANGVMNGYVQAASYTDPNCPKLTYQALPCAQSSRTETAGTWAQPAQISTASVKTVSAPEIDPTSAGAGLTLLFAGLAVMRGRRLRPAAIRN